MISVLRVVVVAVLAVAIGWYLIRSGAFGEMGRSWKEGRAVGRERRVKPSKISEVGEQTAAGLACPKCGGTQFKAGRKTSTKLAFGATSMLGQAHFVRCVTCGTRYRRG